MNNNKHGIFILERLEENNLSYEKKIIVPKRRIPEKNKKIIIIDIKGRGILDEIKKNVEKVKNGMKFIGYSLIIDIIREPSYKLIVGHGEDSAFETSISIHHTYGCPYISSSAIKGIFRSYLEKISVVEVEKKEIKISNEMKKMIIRILFGSDDNSGVLIFLDSFPNGGYKIIMDNIAPKYSDYYSNKKVPIDGEAAPIFFPALEDTKFRFLIGIDKALDNMNFRKEVVERKITDVEKENIEKIIKNKKILEELFSQALFYEGIGAKTSSGYGAMIKA